MNGKAEALSVDHKPADQYERARIENAGGFVEFNRVNGNLALSRAVGDFAFKGNSSLPAEDQVNELISCYFCCNWIEILVVYNILSFI